MRCPAPVPFWLSQSNLHFIWVVVVGDGCTRIRIHLLALCPPSLITVFTSLPSSVNKILSVNRKQEKLSVDRSPKYYACLRCMLQ